MDGDEQREHEEREERKEHALERIYDETGIIGRHLEYIDKAAARLALDDPKLKRSTIEGWQREVNRARSRLVARVGAARASGRQTPRLEPRILRSIAEQRRPISVAVRVVAFVTEENCASVDR